MIHTVTLALISIYTCRSKLLALLSKKSNIIIAVENKDEMSDDTDDMFMKTPRGKNIVPKKKVSKVTVKRVLYKMRFLISCLLKLCIYRG